MPVTVIPGNVPVAAVAEAFNVTKLPLIDPVMPEGSVPNVNVTGIALTPVPATGATTTLTDPEVPCVKVSDPPVIVKSKGGLTTTLAVVLVVKFPALNVKVSG